MRSLLRVATLACVALVFGLGSPDARSQVPNAGEALVGTYRNVAADGGRSSIEQGTDQALAAVTPLVRVLARPRILENNPPVRHLTIEIGASTARVAYEGQRSYRGPINRSPGLLQRAPDGSDVRVHYLLEGNALIEIAEANGGTGRTRYERSGDELVVRTVIEADRLPAPIRFAMRFARRATADEIPER